MITPIKPTALLKVFIMDSDNDKWRQLQERLVKSESEELCIHRAVLIMGILVLLSFVGLGYCTVLLPEFSSNISQRIIRSVCALGLASLFCQVVFLGCWVWYRKALKKLREECRRLFLSIASPELDDLHSPLRAVDLHDRFLATF
jgi:hypothetical protein